MLSHVPSTLRNSLHDDSNGGLDGVKAFLEVLAVLLLPLMAIDGFGGFDG
jgi:hypothetical protein